jgi:hypothetical protein
MTIVRIEMAETDEAVSLSRLGVSSKIYSLPVRPNGDKVAAF